MEAGGRGSDELEADLALMGLSGVVTTQPEAFVVWPENARSLEVFLALATQWRWLPGMGGAMRVGLDYPAAEAVLRMLKVRDRAGVFNDLRVMEAAALDAFAAQA